jgi:gamma-carbonic anhydrase
MVAASHAGEIWAGRPAKLLRKLEEEEMAFICRSADNYAVLAADHAIENAKTFPEVRFRGLGAAPD